jgi:hypothetical protein
VSISQTGRPTDDTFKCQAAHRGVDEPTDVPASRVNQGTELREEFEERPLRGANCKFETDPIAQASVSPYILSGLASLARHGPR